MVKLFFDGGCRPNPGRMETAVVCQGRAHIVHDAGDGTSFDAEWLALIAALRIAQAAGLPAFVLLGDAATVIRQAQGVAPARGAAVHHLRTFRSLVAHGGVPRVRYIRRTQNLAGIALARLRAQPS